MNLRKKIALFKTLRRHRSLAEKRSMDFSKNKVARFAVWIGVAFLFIYLMGFAIMLAMIANESRTMTSIEFICAVSPMILVIDFFFRFTAQQTPSQLIKPYILLPIPKYTCIDNFIATALLSSGNLIWFAMFIPYVLMSVLFAYGIGLSLGLLFFFWLAILANSMWYSIVRTLINDTILWWILPLVVYSVMCIPAFLGKSSGMEQLFDAYSTIGTAIGDYSVLPYLGIFAILVILVMINRRIQYVHIWRELSRTETTKLHSVSRFSFLDRYGEIGQYLQLEIKSIMRNKNPRKAFIFATAIIIVFSLIISFTDIYDSQYMANFLCLYNFVIYGNMQLTKIMCNEGNYIDCLMVRKENILSLLHAKFLFCAVMLLLPFILMLPTIFTGKWSLLMLFSYAAFTCGFQYFILFQMAVYNKQSVPLNTKFISKAGMENNSLQIIISMGSLFVPVGLVSLLQAIMSTTMSYIVMLIIGVVFMATYRIWMRNIYNRTMRRRYEMMEGFHASR